MNYKDNVISKKKNVDNVDNVDNVENKDTKKTQEKGEKLYSEEYYELKWLVP